VNAEFIYRIVYNNWNYPEYLKLPFKRIVTNYSVISIIKGLQLLGLEIF